MLCFSLFFYPWQKQKAGQQPATFPVLVCLVSIKNGATLNHSVWMKVCTTCVFAEPKPSVSSHSSHLQLSLVKPNKIIFKRWRSWSVILGTSQISWWGCGSFPLLLSTLRVVNPNSGTGYSLDQPRVCFCSQTRRISAGLTSHHSGLLTVNRIGNEQLFFLFPARTQFGNCIDSWAESSWQVMPLQRAD